MNLIKLPFRAFASYAILAIILTLSSRAFAQVERNLLQKTVDLNQLKNLLVLDQKWVSYPSYPDRAGWDKLTGIMKVSLIQKWEGNLHYKWQGIRVSDYLEYERTGSRQRTEEILNRNSQALNDLVLAELAEGKGRFMDQIIDGVWFYCEMTTWVAANHLTAMTKHKPSRPLPISDEVIVDLTVGDMSTFLAWTYYFLKEPMDNVHPEISIRLRRALQERILDPYMQRTDYW